MADAEEIWRRYGLQVVGWQTGFNPVIAMELLATGAWSGAGVLGPEAFDSDPYLELLDRDGIHHALIDMEPGVHRPTRSGRVLPWRQLTTTGAPISVP